MRGPDVIVMELVARTQYVLSAFEAVKSRLLVEEPQSPADVVAVQVFKEMLANDHETLVREVAADAKMLADAIAEAKPKMVDGIVVKHMTVETAKQIIDDGIALSKKLDVMDASARAAVTKIMRLVAESN
jgi:hypothetical protein